MQGPVDVDEQPIAWRECGAGDLVLFLHGLGGSRISWEPQLAVIGRTHRAVAWDLPGYGASLPLAEHTFRTVADAAAGFIDRLSDRPAHVVGISMGGMIAQYLAAWHPDRVRSLTLLSSSPKFGLDGTEPDEWRAARLAPLDRGLQPADFATTVLQHLAGPGIAPGAFEQQRAAMCRITADGLRRSVECLVHHDSRALLAGIGAPTLVMVGEADDETPPLYSQYLAEHIPGARLVTVPGAGHLLNAEAPDAVNAAILDQLTHVEAV